MAGAFLFGTGTAATAAMPAGIQALENIPFHDMIAIQPDGGAPLVIKSKDTHYILKGVLYDVWSGGKPLRTLADIHQSAQQLDLNRLDMKADSLDPIVFGAGPEVVIFTQPECGACKVLLDQAKALQGRFTFKVLPIPAFDTPGNATEIDLKALSCAIDRPAAEALFFAGQPIRVAQSPICRPANMVKRVSFAELLGIRQTVVVSPDHRRFDGVPQDLAAFLSGRVTASIANTTATPGMEIIPAGGLVTIQPTNGGPLVIMSRDAHFALKGYVADAWQNDKPLLTLVDVRDATQHFNLQKLEMKVDELDPITFGTGPQVLIFTDPKCPPCKGVLDQALALQKQYTFKVLVIPAFGAVSEPEVRAIACAADRHRAEALFLNGQPVTGVPQVAKCMPVNMEKRKLTATRVFGIREVPVVIAPDSRRYDGAPPDLAAFLAGTK